MNKLFQFPKTMSAQARNAFRLMVIFLVGSLPFVVFLTFQAFHSSFWQIQIMPAVGIVLIASEVLALVLMRRGRHELGIWLVLIFFQLVLIYASVSISGLGVVLLAVTVTMTTLIASQTLPRQQASYLILSSILSGVTALLVDLFIPIDRTSLPGFQNIVFIVVGALVLIYSYFLARRFRDYSLRTKLVSAFLIVALIPMAVTFFINNNTTRKNLTKDANAALSGAAAQTAAAVDTFMAAGLNDVRVTAQSGVLKEYLLLPVDERAGSEIESVLGADLRSIARRDQTFIDAVGLIDKNGIDVADSATGEVGLDKSTHQYVAEPLRTGLPYSTVLFSPTTQLFSLYFSAPVRDENGNIIGVLRIRYKASVLQQIITQSATKLGLEGGELILLDENHIRLAVSDSPELILRSIVPLATDKLAQLQAERRLPADKSAEDLSTNLPEFEKGLNNVAIQPIFAAETKPEGSELAEDVSGEQIAVASLDTQPWLVAAAQQQTIYLAPLTAQTRTAGVTALIIAGLAALAAVFVSQTISSPIVQLRNVAVQIAGGDLHAQAPVRSGDETGQLASAFNQMTAQLQKSFQDLDQRAAQFAAVAEVSTSTSTILETSELLHQVVNVTKERFSLYHAHIYLLDEADKNLVLAAGAGEPGRQMMAKGLTISLDREQSLVARAARERRGVTANDVTQAPDFLPNPLLPDTRSELAVPMIVGEQVIGVFDVQSDIAGRFTDVDIAVQTTLASQVASAVQNARSYSEVQAAQQLTRTVIDSTNDWIFIKDRQHRYVLVNQGYSDALHIPAEEFIGKDDLDLGFPEELVKGNPEKGIRGFWSDDNLVLETGEVHHYPDDPATIDGTVHTFDTLKIPLRDSNGYVWAVLGFARDITERKRLEEQSAKHAQQQEAINLITQRIQSATTVEMALQVAARELGRALGHKPTVVALEPGALASGQKSALPE